MDGTSLSILLIIFLPLISSRSDLPSDTEDTFFFSPSEADDYHREKRRRTMGRDRESRLQALRDTDQDDDDSPDGDLWGGSDEEVQPHKFPSKIFTDFMRIIE